MPSNLKRPLNYVEAIREAFDQSMAKDSNVIVIGEGVPDPKAIFGSTDHEVARTIDSLGAVLFEPLSNVRHLAIQLVAVSSKYHLRMCAG